MRRTGNLFDRIITRENMRWAFHRAARGKRHRPDVRAFSQTLEQSLSELADLVATERFTGGRFVQFEIRDPKRRLITAPAFPERVLHHALIRVCEPTFEHWLIHDTYACRPGKGTERAVLRAAEFARCFPWRVQLDVKRCFDSVCHERLRALLEGRFKDQRLLRLFGVIIGGYQTTLGRGLPIGSLTSQHLANFFLGHLDRHVKEVLQVGGYVRYMDDIVLCGTTKAEVTQQHQAIRHYLSDALALAFKPAVVRPSARGLDYLGFRVFPRHISLSRRSRRRFRRKLRILHRWHRFGALSELELQQRVSAATAFVQLAGARSWQFRASVLQSLQVGDP